MGNTCAVNQTNNLAEVDDFAENGRFNSYLATLPKLFTETTVQGEKFLCTAYVTSNFKSVIFAAADIKKNFFMKQVTRKKLNEIRDKLDVNNTIGWWNFFSALKHAFIARKVSLKVDGDECLFNIDLNFAVIGRTCLSLPLKRDVSTESLEHLTSFFVNPLHDFYSARIESAPLEKLEQLEKQIKLYKDKIAEVEREIKEKYPNSNTPEEDDDGVDELVDEDAPIKQEAKPVQPKEEPKPVQPKEEVKPTPVEVPEEEDYTSLESAKVIKFLNDIKTKLTDNNSITLKEKQSFERIIGILSTEDKYQEHLSKELLNDMDLEVFEWAKIKFANDNPVVLRGKEQSIEFATAEEAKKHLESNEIILTAPREQILNIFDKLDLWSFDVFELFNATGGNPLFATCYTLFLKYGFVKKFNINEEILINFLRELEAGYHPNPYHNNAHAADVLQATHFIVKEGGLIQKLSPEDCFAALVSATIHDYDHPGLNNAFQVNTRSYLATLYNDRAVLENHHCAQAFELMRQDKYNILSGLSNEQKKDIRETIVEMLLATDMGQHAKIVGKFKGRLEAKADFKAKDDIRLALQIAIKMADVSNPARPLGIALKWTERITDEFFAQGDLERNSGLAISPMMDRATQHIGKGQIAFINYLVTPMYEMFFNIAPGMQFCKKFIENNRSYWEVHAIGDKNDYDKLWWEPPAAEPKEE